MKNPLKFVLVTPSYNLSEFIEQTIYSVVGQAGDFSIRYHVQDGGSTDGTLAKLEKWNALLDGKDFPKFCRDVSFTYSTGPDAGMYDAINRGFDFAVQGQESCIMSWINADDLLLPGALTAISSFLTENPSAQLVGGRIAVVCPKGFVSQISRPESKPRADIARGLYNGRQNDFINQEGTFWRSELWHRAGGLNSSLKLAGDFDLWLRFARDAEYHTLDSIIGAHRKREGQLSSDMAAYHDEVDAVLREHEEPKDIEWVGAGVFRYDKKLETWKRHLKPQELEAWHPISGLGYPEGPYPELGIDSGRWVLNKMAELTVRSELSGDCILSIEFRNPFIAQNIVVNGKSWPISKTPMKTKLFIHAPFRSEIGLNNFTLGIETLVPEQNGDRNLGIFIDDVKVVSKPTWRSKAKHLLLNHDT